MSWMLIRLLTVSDAAGHGITTAAITVVAERRAERMRRVTMMMSRASSE